MMRRMDSRKNACYYVQEIVVGVHYLGGQQCSISCRLEVLSLRLMVWAWDLVWRSVGGHCRHLLGTFRHFITRF